MAKDIIESVDIIPAGKVLKRDKTFYDGMRGEIVTFYKKGTEIASLTKEHQKYLDSSDYQKGE